MGSAVKKSSSDPTAPLLLALPFLSPNPPSPPHRKRWKLTGIVIISVNQLPQLPDHVHRCPVQLALLKATVIHQRIKALRGCIPRVCLVDLMELERKLFK